jgi:osmoprotectant transport system ATP-binding protein
MSAIELRGVAKRYDDHAVVDRVSLTIEEGQTFCFIGPSGCGKSTTLRMMNRLVEPSEGAVLVENEDVRGVDVDELRRRIGYVIQDVGLIPHYTISRNVGIVPELLGWSAARRRARVAELLETVGLPEADYGHRYPRQLSGGERQRVGIARALAADPPIVLLDEPFSALDPVSREHLQDEFLALSRRLRKTFVMVTHDVLEAVRLAHCIGVMREGRLVQCGAPREIIEYPADDGVLALLGRSRSRPHLADALGE